MPHIKIEERVIGPEEPAYIIAEIGINHNGSVETAKKLIDIAAKSGADAVKFQKRKLEETYVKDVVENPEKSELDIEYTVSNLKDVCLKDSDFRELAEYSRDRNLDFLCSPWDEPSVKFLEELGVPAYKIGSPDLTNFPLLETVIDTEKPIILSTGMSKEKEIDKTVEFMEEADAAFAVLHCKSTYPTPFHNINLKFMNKLKEKYNVPTGYSGHERGIAVSEAAVARGACIIERHITLDRNMDGPDHSASLEPEEFRQLVQNTRDIESSLGDKTRYLSRGEYLNRKSLSKSLVAAEDISEGDEIRREDLKAKAPSHGISPQELYTIVGSTANSDINEDSLLHWTDIEPGTEDEYKPDLVNWGVVVRFSDIDNHDWGNPDIMEFRLNGADLDEKIDINDYPMKRLTVHAPEQIGHELLDPSSLNENTRMKAEKILQKTIDKTRDELAPHFSDNHPPMIVIHPGGVTETELDLRKADKLNRSLEKTLNNLDDRGVQLLLENMPPLPWIYGGQQHHNNFLDAERIAEYCKRNNQRICYDLSHAALWCNYTDKDLKTHMRELIPYIDYLHISDAAGVDGEGLQIGEGEIDWSAIAPLIRKLDVPMTTEIWRGHEKSGKGFKKAAERLERILNEN